MLDPESHARGIVTLPIYTMSLYRWCIERATFTGQRGGVPGTRPVNANAFILTDSKGVKTLVNMDPSRLSWSTTILTGTKQYSQSTYVLTPNDETSTSLKVSQPTSMNMARELEGWRKKTAKAAEKIRSEWFHFSTRKTFNAPLPEVFAWCTDYRDTDAEFAHMIRQTHKQADASTQTMKILYRSVHEVRYVTKWYDKGKLIKQFTNVYLYPPNRWLAVGTGDYWDSQAAYILTEQDGLTMADVRIHNRYRDGSKKDEKEMSKTLSHHWDRIIEEFNRDRTHA